MAAQWLISYGEGEYAVRLTKSDITNMVWMVGRQGIHIAADKAHVIETWAKCRQIVEGSADV